MSIPGFSAQASLYRTGSRYYSSSSESGDFGSSESITLAYYPGPGTQANCNRCLETATKNLAGCLAIGSAGCGLGCIAAGPFYAACFAPCIGGVIGTCDANMLREAGMCAWDDCCPKICGVVNPFDPGQGCCDENEACVDRYDPNSRGGCCPSDQVVCSGKCCAKGETCCGGDCCPPNYYCLDGFCSEYPGRSLWPDEPPVQKKGKTSKVAQVYEYPSLRWCPAGKTPCGDECCPPELECCFDSWSKTWRCQTTCLH